MAEPIEPPPPDSSALPPSEAEAAIAPRNLGSRMESLFGIQKTNLATASNNSLAAIRTDLSISRTLMAADRTLMAWIRTALSLNSFGFTIYKLLDSLDTSQLGAQHTHAARNMGLFLTGMGTFAMVFGVIEYAQNLRELRSLKKLRYARPSFFMGLLMAAMGLILFFGIVSKLF